MRGIRLLLCISIALALYASPLFIAPAGAWSIGSFTHVPLPGSHPEGICAGPDGALWFCESATNKIGRATSGPVVTDEYAVPSSPGVPISICAGPDGALWFTEIIGNKIGRITTAGAITEYAVPTGGSRPYIICAGPDGNLWFTENTGNKIGRCTTAGVITEYAVPTTSSVCDHICAGPDGNLWFTEYNASKIGRCTTAGAITEYPLTPGRQPCGIAAGPDGALWFCEDAGNRIGRITTAGVISEYPVITPNAEPLNICHGPGNMMWFTEYNGSRIGTITMGGTVGEMAGSPNGPHPTSICFDGDTNLWYTANVDHTVMQAPVTGLPFITGITPAKWARGTTVHIGDLQGFGFDPGIIYGDVKLARQGEIDIYANNLTVASGNRITCDFIFPATTAPGRWNVVVKNPDGQCDTLFGGFEVTELTPAGTWYLPEGCTAGGFETWVLVQNPNPGGVIVDLTLMTEAGPQNPPALQGRQIPAESRTSFNIGDYVQTYDVSIKVDSFGGNIVCERAMYGNDRTWGTDSIGSEFSAPNWYLAEGCTAGGFETWVLVQNPNATPVTVNLTLMTDEGKVNPPALQGAEVPANSRRSFNLGDHVQTYDVSTQVDSTGGNIVCERAMYGNDRQWAHDSIGTDIPKATWYLPEGCTADGFETWVLVQNPNATPVTVNLTLMTDEGKVNPPALQGAEVPANSRRSFNLGDHVQAYDVSTQVDSTGGKVVCERAMYGGNRTWGTDSIGAFNTGYTWMLAEGCTGGGFETWVLVQNPNATPVTVGLTFMTSTGPKTGPQGVSIPAYSRQSFNVGGFVYDWNVSTKVASTGGAVVCERAMYGNGRQWAHDSVGCMGGPH